MTTDPAELMAAAKCYACIPDADRNAVLILILATIAGLEGQTPAQLLDSAKCYTCLGPKDQLAVITYLLTQINS